MVENILVDRSKVCTKCRELKQPDHFGKAPRKPNSLSTVCKKCTVERQARWNEENKTRHALAAPLLPPEVKCRSCREVKSSSEFVRRANTKLGFDTECGSCLRKRDRDRYRRDRAKRKEQSRWGQMKQKFGMTKADWESLFEKQNGQCAICDAAMSRSWFEVARISAQNSACVDHDHDTGNVRSLLCRHCNQGIGLLRDSSRIAERAAAYLRSHGK